MQMCIAVAQKEPPSVHAIFWPSSHPPIRSEVKDPAWVAPGPQAQGGGWAESDHSEQIAVKYTEKGMSSLAFWVQGGLLEGLARGLHLGGRTDIPQMREEMWAPGQRARVAFHRHGGKMKMEKKIELRSQNLVPHHKASVC